jgi:integrase
MSRIRLPHVQQFNARGHRYYYFRKLGCVRIRLPGLPGSPEFMDAYKIALAGAPRIEVGEGRTIPGTISALVVAYYKSGKFKHELSAETQRYRRNVIEEFRAKFGKFPVKGLQRPHLVAMVDKIDKPHARKNWLKALRGLLQYAVEIGMLVDDPSATIKIGRLPKSDGFRTWRATDIVKFRAHHAIGTRARLAFELLLNTSQRRGDVVHMGRQHIHPGKYGPVLHVRQSKTGVSLKIPITPDLAEVIEATHPVNNLTFLTTAAGKPFTAAGFGNWFLDMCDEAGLHGFSAHGLRKGLLTLIAEAGGTEHELKAVGGHLSLSEVQRYTKGADQEALAWSAMTKLRTSSVKQADPAVSNKGQAVGNKHK